MLQIMYGNDRTNYRLIAKSAGISDDMEAKLYRAYKNYYMPSDIVSYSERKYYPKSISYSVSDLDRMLEEKQIILCLNAQMDNIQTPCTYFHGIIFKAEKKFFQSKFDRVFQYQFVKAEDLMKYDGGDAGRFAEEFDGGSEGTFAEGLPADIALKEITQDQIRDALLNFYTNELQNKETRWVLDVEGDEYNSRCMELLKVFYGYLPWQNKRNCGFITYCDERQRVSSRIRIRIFDRTQLGRLRGYFDWENSGGQRGSREVKRYVEFLLEASASEKAAFEQELEAVFDVEEVTAAWAVEYYAVSKVWRQEEPADAFASWKSLLMKYRWEKNKLYELLLELLKERLTNDLFHELLLKELEEADCSYSEMPWKVSTTLEAAELLPWIQLDTERIWAWEFRVLQKQRDVQNDPSGLQEELQRLENMPGQGEKQNQLKGCLCQKLQEEIAEILGNQRKIAEGDVRKNIPENIVSNETAPDLETERILSEMSALKERTVREIPQYLNSMKAGIKHWDSSGAVYARAWRALFQEKYEKLEWFCSEQEYQNWKRFLDTGKEILGEEEYVYCLKEMKKKEKYLESFQNSGKISILQYRNLEGYYWTILLRSVAENRIGRQENRDFVVTFRDGKEYVLSEAEMRSIVMYLLYKDGSMPEEVFLLHNGLVQSLLSSELFHPEHFRDLMTGGIDSIDKELAMDYFMAKENSGAILYELDAVLRHLEKNDGKLLARIQKKYANEKKIQQNPVLKLFKKNDKKRG